MIRTLRFASLGLLATLACAATSLAQEHMTGGHDPAAGTHEHGAPGPGGVIPTPEQGITPMIVAILVFVVVFVVLSAKVWPTVVKGLKDREMKIRSSIEEAEAAQRQAKAALEQYERNLASARAEAQKMLEDAKTQQLAIAAELRAKADAELGALRDKAKRDIDTAKSAAIAEIHQHATDMATAMAAKILRREINAGDQQRLIQESLQELQAAGRA
jgi:F-type H+-transporting ATPase subunit b